MSNPSEHRSYRKGMRDPAEGPSKFIQRSKEQLLLRMREEHRPDFILPIHLGLTELMAIVGNLHLALRHPENTGPSAAIARYTIDAIVQRLRREGFPAHAEVMRLGADPAYDEGPDEVLAPQRAFAVVTEAPSQPTAAIVPNSKESES